MKRFLCRSQKYLLKLKWNSLNQFLTPDEFGEKYIFYLSKNV